MNPLKLKKYILVFDFFLFTAIVGLGILIIEFDYQGRSNGRKAAGEAIVPGLPGPFAKVNRTPPDVKDLYYSGSYKDADTIPQTRNGGNTANPVVRQTQKTTPPNMVLTGIIFRPNSSKSYAFFFFNSNSTQDMAQVGEWVNGWRVEKILRDRVILKKKESEWTLLINEGGGGVAVKPRAGSASLSNASQSKTGTSPVKKEVDRFWRELPQKRLPYVNIGKKDFKLINDMASGFAKGKSGGVDTSWVVDEGRVLGLKLSNMPKDHPLAKYGAKKGDILLSVNGDDLDEDVKKFPMKMRDMYMKYREKDFSKNPAYFLIKRGDEVLELRFFVK